MSSAALVECVSPDDWTPDADGSERADGSAPLTVPDLDRFMQKVVFVDGHWLWTGRTDADGYGRFDHRGRTRRAHRLAYEWFTGPLAPGILALHTCHIRPCVCPDHLYAGSHHDNMRDKAKAGRSARQGRPKTARVPPAALTDIRGSRLSNRAVARKWGISASHVANIRAGRRRGGEGLTAPMPRAA